MTDFKPSDLMTKIALHYEIHRECGMDICPMLITQYEAYQLINELKYMFNEFSPTRMPMVGDNLLFNGVQLYVIQDKKND